MNTSRCPAIQGVIFASIGIKMASSNVDRGAERTLRKAINTFSAQIYTYFDYPEIRLLSCVRGPFTDFDSIPSCRVHESECP